MGRLRPSVIVLLAAMVTATLTSCQPLYVPPIPARLPVEAVAQLSDASSLQTVNGTLRLHLVLERIPKADWLAVQWFGPDGLEVASDSVWVTPADQGQGRTLTLPERVTLRAGEWRAVTSIGTDLLRQFRIDVPASALPAGSGTP